MGDGRRQHGLTQTYETNGPQSWVSCDAIYTLDRIVRYPFVREVERATDLQRLGLKGRFTRCRCGGGGGRLIYQRKWYLHFRSRLGGHDSSDGEKDPPAYHRQ